MGMNQSILTQKPSDNTLLTITNIIDQNDSDDEYFEACSEDLVHLNDEIKDISKPSECSKEKYDDDGQSKNDSNQISSDDDHDHKEKQRNEMEIFCEEMDKKREIRQKVVKNLRAELTDLQEKLLSEMQINTQLREELKLNRTHKSLDELKEENKRLNTEIAECQMYLQKSNSENIDKSLENQALRDQVRSLKEVVAAMKEMMKIREKQVDQLKSKLKEIEVSMSDQETKLLSTSLQQEYQRNLDNFRNIRELYEERAFLLTQERDNAKKKLEEKEQELKTEDEKLKRLEDDVSLKNDNISHLEKEIASVKEEKAQLTLEMSSINRLIASFLLGFNSSGISTSNIDTLIIMLEQNRELLNEMAVKEDFDGNEGYLLPKILYDIFIQIQATNKKEDQPSSTCENSKIDSHEEIAEKLPKVWRVLIELLNHHKKINDFNEESVLDSCYQTPSGQTQNVLSVSKTFIKLKDLILEKRSILKDTTRLRTLYSHLELRLNKQEKRLSTVSLELTKTWHLVGKIKRQHRQLHTHEQILCYQLQQKRRVLNELKAELEYCRKKWSLARSLNNDSEEQCKALRKEFSMRKVQDQNSAESGYSAESDEHLSDDDDSSTKIKRVRKFDENLIKFDRTASPTYIERRHSMITEFSPLFLDARAQSEPPIMNFHKEPCILSEDTSVEDALFLNSNLDQDLTMKTESNVEKENFLQEELHVLADTIFERCSLIDEEEQLMASTSVEPDRKSSRIVATPPPQVFDYNPKLRVHLRLCKKLEGRKERERTNTETAEDMYLRLMGKYNSNCNTCSSSSSIDEDDSDSENVEKIQEIPFDDCTLSNSGHLESNIGANEVETIEISTKLENNKSNPEPCTSKNSVSVLSQKEQDYLHRREERLNRLEAETKAFYDKMSRNKEKSIQLDNHINEIHNSFLQRNKEHKTSQSESDNEKNSDSESD